MNGSNTGREFLTPNRAETMDVPTQLSLWKMGMCWSSIRPSRACCGLVPMEG